MALANTSKTTHQTSRLVAYVSAFITIASAVLVVSFVIKTYVPSINWPVSVSDDIGLGAMAVMVISGLVAIVARTKSGHKTAKDKAFDALAAELSSVASRSEIVINGITDGVLSIDGRGTIQLINPAAQAMLGWGKHDAMGLDYRSVIKIADQKGTALIDSAHPIDICLSTGRAYTNDDINLVTENGKLIALSLMVSPIGNRGDGVIAVFRDVTTQRSEEQQQNEFVSTASHEMRTPVAAIEGYLGLALNPSTATIDDKARAYLSKAHESAQHLGRLFQDLLDVSKADDGRLTNNPVVIDIIAFLADQVSGFEQKARDKGLVLLFKPLPSATSQSATVGGDKRLAPVMYTIADYDHLLEVMSNVIENAIKYTKTGSVSVDVVTDDATLTVLIKDSGIGIPAEDLTHLFQKFYRVDNTDTREIGGTGLGLYLCRKLIESMSGRIWVESTYGEGSTFHIQLPRISHEEAMSQLERATAAANAPLTQIQTRTNAFMTDPSQPTPTATEKTAP